MTDPVARSLTIVAFLVGSSAPALAQTAPAEPDRYVYWPHMGWEVGWHGGGPIMMLMWIGIAVAAIVLLARAFAWSGRGTTGPHTPSGSTALTSRERFARGEIDKAEFEDKRRTLGE